MERPKYMRLPIKIIPQEIIENYNLRDTEVDEWVCINIVKDLYGLPQAGKIANELLEKRLK